MVVLSVTNCPQQLRGDLTKWFIEIDIGVYVGKITARVREKIWSRVCDNIKTGKAIMVYSTNSEQGFAILTHNTAWTPIDCEGIWLMQKSNNTTDALTQSELVKGFSKAAQYAKRKKYRNSSIKQYVILDLETTGLNFDSDRIIEIGMLRVVDGHIVNQYQNLINSDKVIPPEIISLTGITSDMVTENGISEEVALQEVKSFIGNDTVVGYNVDFDIKFIKKMCERHSQNLFICKCKDILRLVRRKLHLDNYRLETVARACDVEIGVTHRALEDCKLINRINNELNIF